MPRSKRPNLASLKSLAFEPFRKNPITLRDDELLDTNLKVIKVGGENTPLSLSSKELRIEGDLFLEGKLISHKLETDNKYLELSSSGYVKVEADYLRLEPTSSSGTLDIYSSSGTSYFHTSGNTQYFLGNSAGAFYFGFLGAINRIVIDAGNRKIRISDDDDVADLFAVQTTDNGATTLSTTDSNGSTGHMTLQPDGDLVLDPVSQNVIINATDKLYFDGGTETYISETGTDTLKIYVGGDEILAITEGIANAVGVKSAELVLDSSQKLLFDGSAAGHTYISQVSDDILDFYVGSDKMMVLDEANDKIIMAATNWVAGTVSGGTVTEFSATNSAYAGMILGYTDIGLDEGRVSYTMTTSYVVPTDEFGVTFVAPPSGNVEIMVSFRYNAGGSGVGDIYVGLSDANATSGYNAVDDFHEELIRDGMGRNEITTIQNYWTLTGLTAGTSYTRWLGVKSSNLVGSPALEYGGDGADDNPDFIMKATALPATIST